MNKFWKVLSATAALLLSAGAAHAGGPVSWSVGINLPPVGTVISGGPVYQTYAPVPVVVPQVVYRPAPVYYPQPVYYGPAVRYYGPPAVVVGRHWGGPHGHWEHRGYYRDDRGYYRR